MSHASPLRFHRALRAMLLLFFAVAPVAAFGQAPEPAPVALLGVMPSAEGVTVQVASDGCMKRDHLTLTAKGDAAEVRVNTPGVCDDHWPLGQRFLLSWADLGISAGGGRLRQPLAPLYVAKPAAVAKAVTKPQAGEDEAVHGYLVEPEGLVVAVQSGGCTARGDFQPWVERTSPPTIHLTRVRPDHCEADMPYGEPLRFTWADLGVTEQAARLANPVEVIAR